MSKFIGMAVLALAAASVAQAGDFNRSAKDLVNVNRHFIPNTPSVAAPEIDPASALGGLTLLAGGLAVIRGRRTKK